MCLFDRRRHHKPLHRRRRRPARRRVIDTNASRDRRHNPDVTRIHARECRAAAAFHHRHRRPASVARRAKRAPAMWRSSLPARWRRRQTRPSLCFTAPRAWVRLAQVGAVGPWRVRWVRVGRALRLAALIPNAETWLTYRLCHRSARHRYSACASGDAANAASGPVRGDIEAWPSDPPLARSKRPHRSPKYLLARLCGFAPALARELQSEQGVGVTGMVLLSPVLDIHNESGLTDPSPGHRCRPRSPRACPERPCHRPTWRMPNNKPRDYIEDLRAANTTTRRSTRCLTGGGADRLDPPLCAGCTAGSIATCSWHELERAQGLSAASTTPPSPPDPSRKSARFIPIRC